jgi:Flp pilus assembly protein TadG
MTNISSGRRDRLQPSPSRRGRSQRGVALIEVALTLPLLLLVSVSIFEFGRAFQTWQVLTNAAREGARMAVLPGADSGVIQTRVRQYMADGQLGGYASATVDINLGASIPVGGATASASIVTVNYPYSFIVLNPVARLVRPSSTLGGAPITISASAQMRNESPF